MSREGGPRTPGRTGLLDHLVDDAAVFPPGLAPWPKAVAEHLAHRASAWSYAVGPLLVPVEGVDGLLGALDDTQAAAGLRVALVSRPGAAAVARARRRLAQDGRTRVVAVELPLATVRDDLATTWSDIAAGGTAVWWELDREAHLGGQLDAVAVARPGTGGAKLRTGGTDAAAVAPTPVLAAFLVGCAARDLPFKLTAGLHHAVRGPDPVTGGTTHGIANVLLATAAAGTGCDEAAVAALLERTDGGGLATELRAMPEGVVRAVRTRWASFGCCGVLDPLNELDAIGVG